MDRADRPLSPHVFHYRWQITMTLSILHRMTGIVLSIGILVLVCWLTALASGEAVYERVRSAYSAIWFLPFYLGWVFCVFYHFANGIRHLFWDVGVGFEHHQIRIGGWLVVAFALAATAAYSAFVIF
jgi:succinate dehydrogenase / fumarate reductase cytochrome b subunit